jgi:hypothetical protein
MVMRRELIGLLMLGMVVAVVVAMFSHVSAINTENARLERMVAAQDSLLDLPPVVEVATPPMWDSFHMLQAGVTHDQRGGRLPVSLARLMTAQASALKVNARKLVIVFPSEAAPGQLAGYAVIRYGEAIVYGTPTQRLKGD